MSSTLGAEPHPAATTTAGLRRAPVIDPSPTPSSRNGISGNLSREFVQSLGTRQGPNLTDCEDMKMMTYGTYNCGYEAMRSSWSRMNQVFSVNPGKALLEELSADVLVIKKQRPRLNLLKWNPVDILAVEQGRHSSLRQGTGHWETLIKCTPDENRPRLVVEMWSDRSTLHDAVGPMSKSVKARWEQLGYRSRFRLVAATRVDGAISQQRLVVVRIADPDWSADWQWELSPVNVPPRPMANLLIPDGLIPSSDWLKDPALQAGDWTLQCPRCPTTLPWSALPEAPDALPSRNE